MLATRFKTLLLREWLQHHRGWLLTMLLPPALFLAVLPFGHIEAPEVGSPMGLAAIATALSLVIVTAISWGMSMLQLPGLARRDSQDRSIEFWLSLPASHSESIGATVLTHALLVPLMALLVGAALGLPIAAAVLLRLGGVELLGEVSWSALAVAELAVLLRLALGLLLATLWLAPLFMLPMAASAWLKRWGVPAVLATVVIGGNVLAKVYGNPIFWTLLGAQARGASGALFTGNEQLRELLRDQPHSAAEFGSGMVQWAWQDGLGALQQLASPHLLGGLLVAAACFALLVLRRRRAA